MGLLVIGWVSSAVSWRSTGLERLELPTNAPGDERLVDAEELWRRPRARKAEAWLREIALCRHCGLDGLEVGGEPSLRQPTSLPVMHSHHRARAGICCESRTGLVTSGAFVLFAR